MWACLSDRIEDSLSCNGGGRRGGDGHSPDANVGSYSNDHCFVIIVLLYDFLATEVVVSTVRLLRRPLLCFYSSWLTTGTYIL